MTASQTGRAFPSLPWIFDAGLHDVAELKESVPMPYPDAGVNRLSFLPQSQCPVSVQGLTDQKDWDIELAEKKGTVNPCGLYDLNRKPRPIAAAYRHLLEKFGRMALVAHGEIFAVSSAPAHPPPAVTFRSLPRRGEPCVRPLP